MARLSYYQVYERINDEILGLLEKFSNETLEKEEFFRLGVSGGSIADILTEGIPNAIRSDFSRWRIFFCDERYVPEDDKDSTFGRYKEMLDNPDCELKLEQFEKISFDLPLDECALDYEKRVRKEFGLENSSQVPEFDMLILGMGPDGHTCSLFEGHQLLDEAGKLIAPIDNSPKPPPKRITMTYPLINNAKIVLVGAAGAGKADVLKKILVDKDLKYPVTRISPTSGRLIYVVDDDAGKFIDQDPSTDA